MSKYTSRIVSLLLTFVFLLMLTACDSPGSKPFPNPSITTTSTTRPSPTTTETTTEQIIIDEPVTVTKYSDLAYGSDGAQKLDLYLPSNASKQAHNGLVLVLHGGAWVEGDKASLADKWERLADEGYIVASMNYRMPHYSINDMISAFTSYGVMGLYKFYTSIASQGLNAYTICDDIDDAIGYLASWFRTNGINVDGIALGGESAGAHEAMLYAYNTRKYHPAIDIKFVIDRSGPCNMDPDLWVPVYESNFKLLTLINKDLDAATASKYYVTGLDCLLAGSSAPAAYVYPQFAAFLPYTSEQGWNEICGISPVSYVNASTVPTIFCYGENDTTVPNTSAATLKNAFDKAGNHNYEYFSYARSGHLLQLDPATEAQYKVTLDSWLDTYFGY